MSEVLSALQEEAILAFQSRAKRFLRRKGIAWDLQEDLASEMLLDVLNTPTRHHNLAYIYLHALNRLDPRMRVGQGPKRIPQSRYTQQWAIRSSAQRRQMTVYEEVHAALGLLERRRPRVAQWCRLLLLGMSQEEVATAAGVTASRVSQGLCVIRRAFEEQTPLAPQPGRPRHPLTRAEILTARAHGQTLTQIAQAAGVTIRTVSHRLAGSKSTTLHKEALCGDARQSHAPSRPADAP